MKIDSFYIKHYSNLAFASAAIATIGAIIAKTTTAKIAGVALAAFGVYGLIHLIVFMCYYPQKCMFHDF